MSNAYIHGYDPAETIRLQDQARSLADLLHADTRYPPGSLVLEAGCGVGAQTLHLATNSPEAAFVSVDVSGESILQARRSLEAAGRANVKFRQGDIFALPFAPQSFDHCFVCFVLEHLARPVEALRVLRGLVKAGGTVTVVEGDHGSAYFHPDDASARAAIACQVRLQADAGGNANVGRQLHPLLADAGFGKIRVSPRMVYADGGRPDLADSFTRKTFAAMVAGVRASALEKGLASEAEFDAGIRALERTAQPDGVFCYTFFKAVAVA